jgi:hypothetical protein
MRLCWSKLDDFLFELEMRKNRLHVAGKAFDVMVEVLGNVIGSLQQGF